MKTFAISPIEEVNLFLEPDTTMADFRDRLKESIYQLSILRTMANDCIDDKPLNDAVMLMSELCFEFNNLEYRINDYLHPESNPAF